MLNVKHERSAERAIAGRPRSNTTRGTARRGKESGAGRSRWARALRVEWLGQTIASLCWIASVLSYGINASGDWLQLFAASAWLLANVAPLARGKDD